jgi:plasmid stabilization system protein ParE
MSRLIFTARFRSDIDCPNARVAVIPPYILIYDYGLEDDTLVLLRVLHERREITPELIRGR